jgi:two-component system response regulator AtoC
VNCAALPSELVESELFGYDKGAFTGAFKNTPGKFEIANGGTILLDEIGDMDLKLQAKLLQVLQDQEFYRLGATEKSTIDVRVMAASHCDFEQAISERRFREDLYYRLNIVDLKIPPLRERGNEILSLFEALSDRHSTSEYPKMEITPILRQVLLEYHWPGNVRELENVVRKYLVLRNPSLLVAEIRERTVRSKSVFVPTPEATPETASVADTAEGRFSTTRSLRDPVSRTSEGRPKWLEAPSESSGPKLVSRSLNGSKGERESALRRVDEARKAAEVDAILNALEASLWNRKRAALMLQIDYKALLYKMRKLGIGEKRTGSLG